MYGILVPYNCTGTTFDVHCMRPRHPANQTCARTQRRAKMKAKTSRSDADELTRLVTCSGDAYVLGDIIAKGGFGR